MAALRRPAEQRRHAAMKPERRVPDLSAPMIVWFTEPARAFHETCALGNGRLGAMDFGGTSTLRIALNESSVWTGGPYDGNRCDAHKCLPRVRKRLFAGRIAEAQGEIEKRFGYADGVAGWKDRDQFGCYQALGDRPLAI